MRHHPGVDSFSATLRCDASLLAGLRHAFAGWLEARGLGEESRASAVLATHEATANAIEHGRSAGSVNVRAHLVDDALMIEVSDQGQWRPAGFGDDERGRGLMLIAALVSDLDIRSETGGTTIRMVQHPRLAV
jgi:anti-sigma regulatory factor (Ser/Thr protein kinase)